MSTNRARKTASPPTSKSDTLVNTHFTGRHPSLNYNTNKNDNNEQNKRKNIQKGRLRVAYWKTCTSGETVFYQQFTSSKSCQPSLASGYLKQDRFQLTKIISRGSRYFPKWCISKRRWRFSNEGIRKKGHERTKIFLLYSELISAPLFQISTV